MEISNQLHCLFSSQIEPKDGSHVIELPEDEIELGEIEPGETYRIAVLPVATPADRTGGSDRTDTDREYDRRPADPPVEPGETREVEIESIGEQGDGIARVERGYVVIVPDTETGERVRIEIDDVRENVAFATVVDRISYYD